MGAVLLSDWAQTRAAKAVHEAERRAGYEIIDQYMRNELIEQVGVAICDGAEWAMKSMEGKNQP